MITLSRRTFVKSTSGLAGLTLMPQGALALAGAAEEPHFFLSVIAPDGLDVSYMFDARPLAMTKAGMIANYLGEEPTAWKGKDGSGTLATKLVKPLEPYREDFSVLNGVLMAATFDGHDQNMNYMFCGNPFGGESFVPHLNETKSRTPLDFVQTGFAMRQATNAGGGIPMDRYSLAALVDRLQVAKRPEPVSPLFGFLRERMQTADQGRGAFAAASEKMRRAFGEAPRLAELLSSFEVQTQTEDPLASDLDLAFQFFRSRAAKSAVMEIRPKLEDENDFLSLDAHDSGSASRSEEAIGSVAAQLARVMEVLKATPYDESRSMMDVTTVMFTSEFSRTMRQPGMPIDGTGTDHNPMNNTVLLGGKGIKGGMVLGASDYRSADEELSGAHRELDKYGVKVMGKPFDFTAMKTREDKPSTYKATDYIQFANVANTIYDLFGISKGRHWAAERNGEAAKVLTSLLA